MNTVSIMLATEYDSRPSHCAIYVCGDLIFDSIVSKNTELIKKIDRFQQFTVKVVKTGKTLDLVNNNDKQTVTIQNINLNGIDLKIQEFGEFILKGNPYVEDETLLTNQLNLNGEWHLELPRRPLMGHLDIETIRKRKVRDDISDCDIACFGCSETWGDSIGYDDSWPAQLQKITEKSVKNLGIGGSNINEIIAFADYFVKNYKSEMVLIYLPHSFRRQLIRDGKVFNTKFIDDGTSKELILHGEEHSISALAGELGDWLDDVSKHTKIYFGTYQTNEHKIYEKTALKKFLFPFLHGKDYPKASDGLHHGVEFNRDFARMLVDFLNLA